LLVIHWITKIRCDSFTRFHYVNLYRYWIFDYALVECRVRFVRGFPGGDVG